MKRNKMYKYFYKYNESDDYLSFNSKTPHLCFYIYYLIHCFIKSMFYQNIKYLLFLELGRSNDRSLE